MGLPSSVEKVLDDYMTLFHQHLPGTMEGVYIHGSIALDAYVENSSDIDFITVTNRLLIEEDKDILSFIHHRIAKKHKNPTLDGVYLQPGDLGKLYRNKSDFDKKYFFYNDGDLSYGDYFNFNPVTWWLLKDQGVRVVGQEVAKLQIGVNTQDLISYVLKNMNDYWTKRIQWMENSVLDMESLSKELIDSEIEWTVLGLLRQFYTLKEEGIIAKLDSGEYGLQQVPNRWHNIIKEAINIRNGVKTSLFSSSKERIESTIDFSKYLIHFCNNMVHDTAYTLYLPVKK